MQTDDKSTYLVFEKNDFRKRLWARINLMEGVLGETITTRVQLERARQLFNDWDAYNAELLKQAFSNENSDYRQEYVHAVTAIANGQKNIAGGRDELGSFLLLVNCKLNILRQLVEKTDLLKTQVPGRRRPLAGETCTDKIFVVHGHNSEVKLDVARTLERLGLTPVILSEQTNNGQTIMEKFESNANASYAIILLTDDDLGRAKNEETLKKRARQNVILELGFFIGMLGRNRVCVLSTEELELPSDLRGLGCIEIDSSQAWKLKMVQELKSAGYYADANKIIMQ